jgi:SAM-dependent methyltransferase
MSMIESDWESLTLRSTSCAICGPEAPAREVYAPAFEESSFNRQVFSARRLPDRLHYRMVRCNRCGLVRSDPIADQATLSKLYQRSGFDYVSEIPHLRRTYGRYLSLAAGRASRPPRRILEVGCGNGFLLEEALAQGFQTVCGVEPSHEARALTAPSVRESIVPEVMRPGLFPPGQFDLVCMFQVFDHLPEPGAILDECLRVLAAGGILLCLHHNVRALSARLLGERSPIIDIEHCYLYDPRTMRLLLDRHGFETLATGMALNTISLQHLVHLLPLPAALKSGARAAAGGRLGRLSIRLPLGNLYAVARRPRTALRGGDDAI